MGALPPNHSPDATSDANRRVPVAGVIDPPDLLPHEARLLEEECDLSRSEKRRLLTVVRALETGDYRELLGLTLSATADDRTRAYQALSQELHPDRYFGRRLGSFGPLLEHVSAAVSQLVRTLEDSRTVPADRAARPERPHRRLTQRLVYNAPVIVRAALPTDPAGATPAMFELETVDVSRGGAYLWGDDVPAVAVGGSVELLLQAPGVSPLAVGATVVWSRSREEAGQTGRRAGLGIRFDELRREQAEQLGDVLALARRAAPAPLGAAIANPALEATALEEPRRFARGTDSQSRPTRIVGIDLGTTFTSVSAAVTNRVQILPWADGSRAIPSVVAFTGPGQWMVGVEARSRQLDEPQHVVAGVKRLLGRRGDDPELAPHMAQVAYERSSGPDGELLVKMGGESYAPLQLCGFLLDAARRNAERVLGQEVERAVVTVPVSFGAAHVELIRRAGQIAGLEVVDVIEEPSAAALACRHTPGFGGRIGIYDFGGGTFDFSVVDATAGDFRVLATAGDSWLGGDDLDHSIADAAASFFWRVHGVDVRAHAVEWQHLLLSAEKAKRDLSVVEAATLFVPQGIQTIQAPQDLRIKVSRDRAEPIWAAAIERSLHTCAHTLAMLGLRPADLTAIYLVGGTSYVPAVRRALSLRFKVPIRVGAPPDHAVCLGAGIQAAQLERTLPSTLPSRQ